MMNRIEDYLDYLFPEPKCELNYTTDYELLIAIMLSAQSTDKRVNLVTPVIFERFPTLKLLKNASIFELENIIRPVGSFRKKSSYLVEIARRLDEEFNGIVPRDRTILESFPGVGRKTVNVFLSEFYNYPAIAVDTHVERVSKRLGFAKKLDNVLTVEKKLMKKIPMVLWSRTHHQLVLFGRYICKAKKPECEKCLFFEDCKCKEKKKI